MTPNIVGYSYVANIIQANENFQASFKETLSAVR